MFLGAKLYVNHVADEKESTADGIDKLAAEIRRLKNRPTSVPTSPAASSALLSSGPQVKHNTQEPPPQEPAKVVSSHQSIWHSQEGAAGVATAERDVTAPRTRGGGHGSQLKGQEAGGSTPVDAVQAGWGQPQALAAVPASQERNNFQVDRGQDRSVRKTGGGAGDAANTNRIETSSSGSSGEGSRPVASMPIFTPGGGGGMIINHHEPGAAASGSGSSRGDVIPGAAAMKSGKLPGCLPCRASSSVVALANFVANWQLCNCIDAVDLRAYV